MRERRPGAGHRLGERAVEREPQAVAGDRLVQRGVALGERERRRVRRTRVPTSRSSNHGGPTAWRRDAHRPAPARASTRRADSAQRLVEHRGRRPRPRPRRRPRRASSAASTSRASAISSSVGVNASRSASSCAGWIAHLPSKPSARACAHAGAEARRRRGCRGAARRSPGCRPRARRRARSPARSASPRRAAAGRPSEAARSA